MGLTVQQSAGRRSCRKKMPGLILWFLFSEMFGDVFPAVALASKGDSNISSSSPREMNKNNTSLNSNVEGSSSGYTYSISVLHRVSKALPQDRNSYENLSDILETDKNTEDVQKAPTKFMTQFVIPYLRPGRSKLSEEIKRGADFPNTMIPVARFGKSVSNSVDGNLKSRSNNVLKQRSSDSLIREDERNFSSEEGFEDDYIFDLIDNEAKYDDRGIFQDTSRPAVRRKRDTSDYDTVIPYPRPGRAIFQNSKGKNIKEQNMQSVFDSLSEMHESDKQNPYSYMLPYPRPGRSNNFNDETETSESLLDSEYSSVLDLSDFITEVDEMQQQSAPSGQALMKKSLKEKGEKESDDVLYSGSIIMRSGLKGKLQNSKDASSDITEFMIPYPRPGKKSVLVMNSPRVKQKSDKEGGVLNDYVLPYPRPGKKSLPRHPVKNSKSNDEEIEATQSYILLYPRPGSTQFSSDDMKHELNNNDNEDNTSELRNHNLKNVLASEEPAKYDVNKYTKSLQPDVEYLNSETDTTDMLTHRSFQSMSKRSKGVIPYPRLGRSANDLSYPGHSYAIPFPRHKRSNSIVPYPRTGRSTFFLPYTRFRKTNSVVPYPRLGRSDFNIPHPPMTVSNSDVSNSKLVPYPRQGRSDSVVPYPRPGRSDSVVPYPRPGRSDSIVPYPRPGRSDSVVPYPRLGHSHSVVPYPRLGRSDSVVPYPRLGRSDSVVPYPRPGRSDSVVPYPRLGRSDSIVPYPRLGRSDSVVPYPRLGRSNSVVPYPRLGRSDSVVPYPRPGRSDSVIPYPRLGRSDSIVPYPRLGRSDSLVPYPRPGRSNDIIPYPRPGRSNSVVPYPRLGRSILIESNRKPKSLTFNQRRKRSDKPTAPLQNNVKMGKYILPNIRPGRSETEREIFFTLTNPKKDGTEKEQQINSLSDNRIREDEIFLDSQQSESEIGEYIWPQIESLVNDESLLRVRNVKDTVIPYPRLGRSEEEATPSPDLINRAHKLNKHMLSRVEDSIYVLPYPRPGKRSF